MRRKIRVTSPCNADRHAGVSERIVEFSGTKLGGLISIRENDDGTIRVEVYRADKGVYVRVPKRTGPYARDVHVGR